MHAQYPPADMISAPTRICHWLKDEPVLSSRPTNLPLKQASRSGMPFLVYWLAWYLTTHQPRDSTYFCTWRENVLSSMPRAGLLSLPQTMSEDIVELAKVILNVTAVLSSLRSLRGNLRERGHTLHTATQLTPERVIPKLSVDLSSNVLGGV